MGIVGECPPDDFARNPPCCLDDGFEKKLYSNVRGAVNYGDPDLEMLRVVLFFRDLTLLVMRRVRVVPRFASMWPH